jgi:hypothetical protein
MSIAPSIGSEKFDDTFLEGLRSVGDPDADAAISEFFDVELGAPAEGLMKALIAHHPKNDDASPALKEFLEQPMDLPEWYDEKLFVRGQNLFVENLPQFGLGLWMASIPAGYAGARDVVVLARTQELLTHPKRRFLETGQFVLDVMTPGALTPGGKGLSDIRHVRLMHAAVRHMLTHEAEKLDIPEWDHASGVPINQEALLATMFTFCAVGIHSVNKFGVHLTDDEKDAYTHTWSVIGSLMGIRDDLLPLDHRAAAEVWDRIKAREYAPTPEAKDLTDAALEVMRKLIPGTYINGFPAAGIRFLLGNDTARMLGIDKGNWTSALFVPFHAFGDLMHRFEHDFAPGRWASGWMGRKVMQAFIDGEWGDERLPRQVKDDPKAAFDVPQELRRRVGLT